MCSECGFSPCLSGCPNAPEPPSVATCNYCGEEIVVGEEYYEYECECYHEGCFYDAAVSLLVEAGARRRISTGDDIDDGGDEAYERMRDEQLF